MLGYICLAFFSHHTRSRVSDDENGQVHAVAVMPSRGHQVHSWPAYNLTSDRGLNGADCSRRDKRIARS